VVVRLLAGVWSGDASGDLGQIFEDAATPKSGATSLRTSTSVTGPRSIRIREQIAQVMRLRQPRAVVLLVERASGEGVGGSHASRRSRRR